MNCLRTSEYTIYQIIFFIALSLPIMYFCFLSPIQSQHQNLNSMKQAYVYYYFLRAHNRPWHVAVAQ
jgi:hypothetical protein